MELSEINEPSEIKTYISLLYAEIFGDEAVPSAELFDSIFAQLSDPNNRHDAYCLKENNEVVAFFTLGESFSIFAHGKYGIINELWVNKAFRSKGVGKLVIEEILNIGKARGWHRIDVSAPVPEAWDRTFDFYKRNGFVYTGRKLKVCL